MAGVWAVSFWSTWRRFPEEPKEHATLYEDLFLRAQAEYLRGEYFAAEAGLTRLLKRRPQDIEARLLLASVFRRTRRRDQARKQLRRLSRTAGPKWDLEVSCELDLLSEEDTSTSVGGDDDPRHAGAEPNGSHQPQPDRDSDSPQGDGADSYSELTTTTDLNPDDGNRERSAQLTADQRHGASADAA